MAYHPSWVVNDKAVFEEERQWYYLIHSWLRLKLFIHFLRYICLCLQLDRTWHKVKRLEGRVIVGVRGGVGWTRAETRALRVYAGHQLTWCNVNRWALLDMDPNMSPARMADYSWNWTTGSSVYTEVSIMQLAHPKVVQPKPAAFRSRVCLR